MSCASRRLGRACGLRLPRAVSNSCATTGAATDPARTVALTSFRECGCDNTPPPSDRLFSLTSQWLWAPMRSLQSVIVCHPKLCRCEARGVSAMANIADMKWFKENFHVEVERAIAGTPFTLDLLVALACQETGDVWPILRRKPELTLDRILALCVGDTIDFKPPDDGRKAFPKNKAALLAVPRGDEMFAIARQALVEMGQFIPGFPVSNPNKFCRGFGMFQFDLQFFKEDPDYFLEKRYEKFSETLGRAIGELTDKAKKIGLFNKPSLSDMELTAVAIAYNTGNFIPSKGLMQGHFDGHKFYGQLIFEFIRMAHTVPVPGGSPILPPPPPDGAIVPPPTPVEATGPFLVVDTQVSPLRVRSAPKI